MGFITGEESSINGINCLRNWILEDESDAPTAVCSNSKGGPANSAAGNHRWRAIANAYGGQPGVLPGSKFVFGGAARNGKGASGNAICDAIDVFWKVESADLLYHQILMSGRGALTYGNPSMSAITGLPAPASAKGLYAKINGSSWSIREARLRVTCENAEYNDSSTAGETGSEPGNFKAQFMLNIYHNDFTFPAKDSLNALILETVVGGATGGWTVNYARVLKITPKIEIEGKNGRPEGVSAIIEGDWSMVYGTMEGTITAPDATIIWPFTYGT